MRIDEHSAEHLAQHIDDGRKHANGLAKELITGGLCGGETFDRVFLFSAVQLRDGVTSLDQLAPADRKAFVMFAVYGMFRIRLSYLRRIQRFADRDPQRPIREGELLNELLAELESLA